MKREIIQHINQLEESENIQILMAVESGSRAWGCPSPDSDYDVRIIFKRNKSEYLEIDDKPDSIDYFHGELLDINGWDVKKVLKLIRRSNATPFEWAQSPVIYKDVDGFTKRILELSKVYFQPRHSVNHYKGIAKNSYIKNDLTGTIKLKKLFYVLRPIMAAKWIIEKNEIPPMDIPKLIDIIKDVKIVSHIESLLKIKEGQSEDYVHKVEPLMSNFLDNEFKILDSVKFPEADNKKDSNILNLAFKDIIGY